jgi:hypothetical protein
MSMKMLAGAAAMVALIATPAMAAQQKAADPQHKSADAGGVKMKSQAKMKSQKTMKSQARLQDRAPAEQRGTGFAPLDFAGNVVGGAVNTAGAIATAPFRPFYGDSYAYYRDRNTGRGVIADDNGPKCLPGKVTTLNGQRMRCQ